MLRSKAADCTVIGKGEAEWSLRDNIVGDSAAAASASAWYTKTFKLVVVRTYVYLQLRGWDQRESSASLLQPYHHNNVRMYVMMNSHTKSGIYIRIFSLIRNGMSELWRRLPACRSVGSRDRFIPSLHTTYVCTSLRLITKANFFIA